MNPAGGKYGRRLCHSKMSSIPVTVIMSVHNGRRFLSAAVNSILHQTFRDFEFIIINDGSTEPVDDIIEGIFDSRIIYIKQRNVGLTRSLNRAIDMSHGEYVARMDSDDVSDATRLEKQLRQVEINPELDMVGTFFDIIGENDKLIRSRALLTDPLYRLWRLQFHNNYAHGSMMMKKSSVQRIGKYNVALKYAQDYDLWRRLSGKCNTMIIPEALYRYRMVDDSAQASVRNYDEQLGAAITISNNSLRTSVDDLTEEELIQVRSVYWNFQSPTVTKDGLGLIPRLFEGFCRRYGLTDSERKMVWAMIEHDLAQRMECESFVND